MRIVRKLCSMTNVKLRSALFLMVICTFLVSFSFWSRCAQGIIKEDSIFREAISTIKASDRPDFKNQELLKPDDTFDSALRYLNRGAQAYNMVQQDAPPIRYKEIECLINKEYTVQCRQEGEEVYMPSSFINKYFEVYGSVENVDGYDRYEFSHSYSLVHPPGDKYTPDGVFMSFEHYNVEERSRVKCVTAAEGVPMSTQWLPEGHFYPIQISQFGLSHYSKYIREGGGPVDSYVLLSGEKGDHSEWMSLDGRSTIEPVRDRVQGKQVLEFKAGSDSFINSGSSLPLKEDKHLSLFIAFKFVSNGSISVTLQLDDSTFHLYYVFSNTHITFDGKNVFHGLGERRGNWMHMMRQLDKDLLKAVNLKGSKGKKFKKEGKLKGRVRLVSVGVHGHGYIDNITLSTVNHMQHFFDAARWLVNHQDSRGGWPIMVTRKLVEGEMELPPGWYSAMGQGQAMSTLVRAYLVTKDKTYLQAAIKALNVFDISSAQGGVKAKFADKYDWYEEYPTTPSSFVLNGFIYSLFGLYDLKQVTSGEAHETCKRIYDAGMFSLKHMLLMFDSGFGTFYDLRHLALGSAPKRARWDYHTTHINQLLMLSIIEDDPLFSNTANRWIEYMHGERAPHN